MRRAKNCELCETSFIPSHSSVRFCGNICNQTFRKQQYSISLETRQRQSSSRKKYILIHGVKTKGEDHSISVGKGTKGKIGKTPNSLLECSSRTVRKILKRLQIGCSRCGWNEGVCDLHHIHGRKIENPHNHSNLTYICPNCHRLFHEGKITKKDVNSFEEQVGNKWIEFYYG